MTQRSKVIALVSALVMLFFGLTWYFFFQGERKPIRAFYFWENNSYSLTKNEENVLDSLNIEKLYVKFFEVERDGAIGIIPVAKTQLNIQERTLKTEIIPTIYIRNEVFKSTNNIELKKFADNLLFLIEKKFNENFKNDNSRFREIQIDCDWTESTQKNYFTFLNALNEKTELQISATLRLYAYKFPERMGILPVDRAMLMCYNLLSPLDSDKRNSILDYYELKKYLVGADEYPVPLDLALPIYSAVQIYQNNRLMGIYYEEDSTFLNCVNRVNGLWYEMKRDTVFNDLYVRKGDRIIYEKTSMELLQKTIDLIEQEVDLDHRYTVALFHLQDTEINRYTHEKLDFIYNHFTR